MQWRQELASAAALAALAFAAGAAIAPAQAEDVTLKMAVPDWPPTHIMKDLFDKEYKAKSGNTVKLDVDFIPWPDYYTRLNASLTSGEKEIQRGRARTSNGSARSSKAATISKSISMSTPILVCRRSSRTCIRR